MIGGRTGGAGDTETVNKAIKYKHTTHKLETKTKTAKVTQSLSHDVLCEWGTATMPHQPPAASHIRPVYVRVPDPRGETAGVHEGAAPAWGQPVRPVQSSPPLLRDAH